MRKIVCLSLVVLSFCFSCFAQPDGKQKIDAVLVAITGFDTQQFKTDSARSHPLGAYTEADFLRRYEFYDSINQVLAAINNDSLAFNDQLNLGLIKYTVEEEVSNYRFKAYLNPILADEGFHTGLAGMGKEMISDTAGFENYIRRLTDIPRYVNEHLELMRRGLTMGISQPKAILDGYENTYGQHIVADVAKSVFYRPFLTRPFGISDRDWKSIQQKGKEAVMSSVIPAFRKIKIFFDTEYLPKTRTTIGVSNFPDGLAYYQDRVLHYTTTNISYEEVYQLGLKEVARIKAEMLEVMKEAKFKGGLQQFIAFLRRSPQFYATTGLQLLKEASFIAKKVDAVLPAFFGKLPRQPYGVEAVPDYLAPTYTAGRYSGASIHGKLPGYYWVNTYNLKSRSLYNLEALTLHEAVPGHHLQGALTQELDSLPAFRRNLYVNAFGEGWGLYAEYLGTEMGFYKDPYTHFGRLTYEMWRACRLVLDVALHTKGWTKQQGIQYLLENTALSTHEVGTEINRYISWPGQALAYKMGELKIKEMRKLAEEKLKDKFDLREFHDLVLSQGTLTLSLLEKMVNRYIDQKLSAIK